jgi:CheY-like chemotaxis protein
MKKKLLLIDDNPFFLKILSDLLSENFLIHTANSGDEAIAIISAQDQDKLDHSGPFDLVITDLEMHGKNGYDVAQFVKDKNRKNKFMPVILLTGKDITKEQAREFGCAACISKNNVQKVVSMVKILFPSH